MRDEGDAPNPNPQTLNPTLNPGESLGLCRDFRAPYLADPSTLLLQGGLGLRVFRVFRFLGLLGFLGFWGFWVFGVFWAFRVFRVFRVF